MAKQATGGSFVKGDKRINRDGRPVDSVSLAALIRRIGYEIATTKDKSGSVVQVIGPDGKPMTVIETILRQRAQDKRYQGEFIDRGWGQVPSVTRLEGADGGPIQTQRVPIDLDKLSEDDLRMLLAIQEKATVTP